MRFFAIIMLTAATASAEPTDLETAFDRLSAQQVRTSGQLQFDNSLWLDTDTGVRLFLSTAIPSEIVEAAEGCTWPEGCRATVTGKLRVHGGSLNLLAEQITFHD